MSRLRFSEPGPNTPSDAGAQGFTSSAIDWRARNSPVFRGHRAPKEWGAREEALRTKPIGWDPPGERPRSKIAAGLGCCAFEVHAQALTEDALRHVSGHDPEEIWRSRAGAVPIPGLGRARFGHVVVPCPHGAYEDQIGARKVPNVCPERRSSSRTASQLSAILRHQIG